VVFKLLGTGYWVMGMFRCVTTETKVDNENIIDRRLTHPTDWGLGNVLRLVATAIILPLAFLATLQYALGARYANVAKITCC
jgi:hypothetical protein